MTLYTVLDEGNILDGEHVEVFTTIARAGSHRDELRQMADDNSDSETNFRVYQLADPDAGLLSDVVDLPMCVQRVRLHAAQLAVEHHKDEGSDDDVLVGTAAALGAYIADGTVPAVVEADKPEFVDPFAALARLSKSLEPKPVVEIRRPHDEALQVVINGEVVAEANHDEHGWSGMDAVEKTALAVARALGVHLGDDEPQEAGGTT